MHLGPLATYVRDRQIPLELAPTCNVQIGAVPSIAHHPVALFHRLGHASDDQHRQPPDEWGAASRPRCYEVASVNGFRWTDVEAVQVTGIQSAFCSLDERRRIEHDVIRPAYAKLAGRAQECDDGSHREAARPDFERDGVLVIEGFADSRRVQAS